VTPLENQWPKKDVDKLTAMFAGGCTAVQVALALGYTRNAVLGKKKRLGLSTPRGLYLAKTPETNARKYPMGKPKGKLLILGGAECRLLNAGKSIAGAVIPQTDWDKVSPKTPGLVRLGDLNEHTCRWPLNNATQGEYYFCGAPPTRGKPYCEHHRQIASGGPALTLRRKT
jgi:GcrA cell cycle regulator